LRILGDRRARDLKRLGEDLQGSEPPVRSPFLPLVSLVLHGLGIAVGKAPPKLFPVFLRFLDLRVEKCGRSPECLNLELLGRSFCGEAPRSVDERTVGSLVPRRFLVRHDRWSHSTRSWWRWLRVKAVTWQRCAVKEVSNDLPKYEIFEIVLTQRLRITGG